MSRLKGIFNFSGTLEPQAMGPLDARQVVDAYEDLFKDTTWQDSNNRAWVYIGMVVACKDKQGTLYQLINDDYTKETSWKAIAGEAGDYLTKEDIEGHYAPLENGLIPSQYIPGATDTVTEVYATFEKNSDGVLTNISLYSDADKTALIKGDTSVIYVDKTTGYQFRWTGDSFVATNTGTSVADTNTVKVAEKIKVEGGPLADLCKAAGITEINTSDSVQDVFKMLFNQEIYPKATFQEGTISASIASPSFTINGSTALCEVGATVNVSAYSATTSSSSYTPRKITGMTYGYSEDGVNKVTTTSKEVVPTVVFIGNYSSTCTINGTQTASKSGTTYSSINIPAQTFTAKEGSNTVTIAVTGAKAQATFNALPSLYIVSNQGNVSEDQKTASAATLIQSSSVPNNSKTMTVTGVYPIYASSETIGTLTKQPLQASKTYTIAMPAESTIAHHSFAIPSSKTVKVSMENTFSGKFEEYNLSNFITTKKVYQVGNGNVEYTVYTRNQGTIDGLKYQITLS